MFKQFALKCPPTRPPGKCSRSFLIQLVIFFMQLLCMLFPSSLSLELIIFNGVDLLMIFSFIRLSLKSKTKFHLHVL